MIARQRAVATSHEFHFGTRQLVLLGGGLVLICGLAFGSGVLVGRGAARRIAPDARAGTDGLGRSASAPRAAPVRTEERLTFYKTLTAPSVDLPVVTQPTIEERIVPKEEPAVAPAAPAATRPPRSENRTSGGRATDAERGGRGRGGADELPLWTIQASSLRSRALAEELRARLQSRGFDAYLLSAATEEGRVRYRVRVGAFSTRAEAERVAADLRADRTLSPFVTPRSR